VGLPPMRYQAPAAPADPQADPAATFNDLVAGLLAGAGKEA
jgi:hypothetical protein